MLRAEERNTTSRRNFLAVLGLAGVTATATVAAALPQKNEPGSKGHFDHPAEYLTAMQAIGWRPVAMYQRLKNCGVHPMGVAEHADEAVIAKNWDKYHAISMRAPIQMAADMPQGNWWKTVWQHLYDNGLREDVTPKKAIEFRNTASGWAVEESTDVES